MQVAERIRGTMASLKVRNESQITIPVPTMSIGIAVFPIETDKIIKLIDLADQRLYTAKERGRDQIEPASAFWDESKRKLIYPSTSPNAFNVFSTPASSTQ